MSLRNLTSCEMIELTDSWVEPTEAEYQVLASEPVMAGLLTELTAAHRDLVDCQPVPEAVRRLSELHDAQWRADERHDDLLRGLWYRLTSEIWLTDDPATKRVLSELRDRLLPDGLRTINRPYRDQVGHCQRVSAMISAEDIELLRQLGTLGGALCEVVREWQEVSRELGDLELELAAVENAAARGGQVAVGQARDRWIRVIELAECILDGDEVRSELCAMFDRIRAAAIRATPRRAVSVACCPHGA